MSELWSPGTIDEYRELDLWLADLRGKNVDLWLEAMREYAINDLFFLVNRVLSTATVMHSEYGTPLFFHDFYLDMCKTNQRYLDNLESSIDMSARRGGKSTIRTFAALIQLGLKYPDISCCIFSVERKLSRKHLRAIKEELESNKLLKALFSDLLWDDPIEATKTGECVWSLEDGLRLRRKRVRTTQTWEQQGYMRGTPVGAGYDVLAMDDMENESVINTPELLETLHDSFAAAVNLATPAVIRRPIIMVTNTLYHPKGVVNLRKEQLEKVDERLVRMCPGEDLGIPGEGPLGGTPTYPFTKEILQQKYDEMSLRPGGKDNYALQVCCSYTAGSSRTFSRDDLQWYDEHPREIMRNKLTYICLDCSKGVVDPTAIVVWATSADKRFYLVGGSRRKMDPATPEFHDHLFDIVMQTSNMSERVVEIRVEQLSQMTWAELIKSNLMMRGVYNINVVPCRGRVRRTGKFDTAKAEREWAAWAPQLRAGLVVLPKPKSLGGHDIVYRDENGRVDYLVDYFLEYEYDKFPRSPHDDVLDAAALLWDDEVNSERPLQFPSMSYGKVYGAGGGMRRKTTWMSA